MSATWSTNADNIAGNWAQHYPILSGLSILFCLLLRHDALRFLGAMDTSCRRDCSLLFLKWLCMTAIEVAAGVGTGRGDKATQDWEAVLSQVARKELWQS